jgi:hypothetical protein
VQPPKPQRRDKNQPSCRGQKHESKERPHRSGTAASERSPTGIARVVTNRYLTSDGQVRRIVDINARSYALAADRELD